MANPKTKAPANTNAANQPANQGYTTQLTPPVANKANVQGTKYYIFNQTGNIMISSTVNNSEAISDVAQKVFAETSVFYAGMTKAISSTINPDTKQPYSLYNYSALDSIISKSGLFVHVTEEDVSYTSEKGGASFSVELIESIIGLATGTGVLKFAESMVSSLGKEAFTISQSSSGEHKKVANIIFVCEYLMGVPLVSALVISMDCDEHQQQLKVGPCFHESTQSLTWKFHKDTYLFVPPAFIKEYAGDMDSIIDNPDYKEFVTWLQDLILNKPFTPLSKN